MVSLQSQGWRQWLAARYKSSAEHIVSSHSQLEQLGSDALNVVEYGKWGLRSVVPVQHAKVGTLGGKDL